MGEVMSVGLFFHCIYNCVVMSGILVAEYVSVISGILVAEYVSVMSGILVALYVR
jgi:hypothetical protein